MAGGNITGRDGYIIAKALLVAIKEIDGRDPDQRPQSDRADMIAILRSMIPDETEWPLIFDSEAPVDTLPDDKLADLNMLRLVWENPDKD